MEINRFYKRISGLNVECVETEMFISNRTLMLKDDDKKPQIAI